MAIDSMTVDWFRTQSRIADQMGSAIYCALLARMADDIEAGGPLAELVRDFDGHPIKLNLPLRVLGAAHALALSGDAPEYAACLPSCDGEFELEAAWSALRSLAAAEADALRTRLSAQIQTNEVRRSCALLPGFLAVASEFELPIRALEIGSSAGLNLMLDRYHYRLGDATWGDESSGVRLDTEWRGAPPPLDAPLRIAERRGCDLDPVDVRSDADRIRLQSFFWPDQLERMERLRAAMEITATEAPTIDRESADRWIEARLAEPTPGHATLIFHSVMWIYLPKEAQAAITTAVEVAGARATADAPLAWLRKETAAEEYCDVHLTTWPGGRERLIARSHYHGAWVEWL